MNKKEKILITGVNGYIGKHLALFLLEEGYSVIGIARSEASIQHQEYHHVITDIGGSGWQRALPEQYDVAIHLAQSKRYREFPDGTLDMVKVNISATAELLEHARNAGAQHFLFASTGNVYKPSATMLAENDPCEPNSMYAASKYAAELLVQQYQKFFPCTIMRIFGVYGPGQKGMTIANMIDSVKQGRQITLAQGKGLCFTPLYIDDCTAIIHQILQQPYSGVLNLAGNTTTHLGEVVQHIENVLGTSAVLTHTDGNPTSLLGSTEKVAEKYGSIEYTSLQQGIKLSII